MPQPAGSAEGFVDFFVYFASESLDMLVFGALLFWAFGIFFIFFLDFLGKSKACVVPGMLKQRGWMFVDVKTVKIIADLFIFFL